MTNWQPNDPNNPQGGQPPQGQPPQAPPPQGPPPGQYGQQPAYGQQPPQSPPPGQYGQPPAPGYGGYPAAPAASAYGPQPGALLPGATRPLQIGDRVIAFIIDAVILAVASIIYYIGIANGSAGLLAIGGLIALAVWIYFIYLTGSTGQTPGKKMMGVKVVDANNGSTVGFGRAFGRLIVQALCNILCYAGLWSAFLDGSSGKYQGWHDKALTTQVISVK